MAHGDDVALADEEMRLAEGDAAGDELRRARDDEECLAVSFELRPLMGGRASSMARSCRPNGRCTRRRRSSEGSSRPIQTTCPGFASQSRASSIAERFATRRPPS